ncbi:MAG TPA: deoxyribonuclease IV [Terriglobales bacterium]|nr:deoxyribonuclease IV [Terriglobales bacterium]
MPPRIGTHVSSAGGVHLAAERAHELGCATMQIFTSSPRQWRASAPKPEAIAELKRLRRKYKIQPLVVHASYLINVASSNSEFRKRSFQALRGELERAAAIGAEYLVLHPGSGDLQACIAGLKEACEGFRWNGLQLLIENTAGGGNHLGGDFGAVAAILDGCAELQLGACVDTCHAWAAGYDLATDEGFAAAMRELGATIGIARVPVLHANDAKSDRGSHLDRHAHIGAGKLGLATFARLLHDRRMRAKAFIVETPPEGQHEDLAALERLKAD